MNIGFNVADSLRQRQETRMQKWETGFDQNWKAVTDAFVDRIAQYCLKKIKAILNDPYARLPTTGAMYTNNVPFDICKASNAKRFKVLSGDSASCLPFSEWIKRFSVSDKNEIANDTVSSSIKRKRTSDHEIDREYFQELMAIIGRTAANKLENRFAEFTAQQGNSALRFKVKWCRKAESMVSNPSDFRDNYLSIQAWINDPKKNVLSNLNHLAKGSVIAENRVQSQSNEYKKILLIGIVALGILYIASSYYMR